MLDGVRAEARLMHQESGEPLLIGFPGERVLSEWRGQDGSLDDTWLQSTVASDTRALQCLLLQAEVPCGLLVTRYGRRGYETASVCVASLSVTAILTDGQELRGVARPGSPGTLALRLSEDEQAEIVLPISLISELR